MPTVTAHKSTASGSTGQPKGVGISHLAVTQSLLAHDSVIPNYSRFLQLASPTFDVSMFEIFFTLFRKSTLVGCERSELLGDLPGMMNKLNVDAAELTPTVAGSLVRTRNSVPNLKLVLTIGEMLTKHVIEEFGESPERSGILYGMYGPTEAAIHCTLQPVFKTSDKVGLIGVPLSTVSAFVIAPADASSKNNDFSIVPWGDMGELAVGGHQLADGYLNRQEQTDSAFLETDKYGRVYRTGDKARFLPDGTIECLGRIQAGQVKLRGQRVELGEIEQAASKSPGCRIAVASVIEGILVLFCLVDSDDTTQQQVKDVCKKWLPFFMLPNEIVILKDLPRLPSGKVDKKALEASYNETSDASSEDGIDEPQDDVAVSVVEAVEHILGRSLRSSDSLTRQGVDSLVAIRLASRLRLNGFSVGAMDILKSTNLKDLFVVLRDRQKNSIEHDAPIAQKFERLHDKVLRSPIISEFKSLISDVLPCTPLQSSLLAETFQDPQAYCNWIEIEFGEGVNAEAVECCLRQLVADNDILRSGFLLVDDEAGGYARVVWSELEREQMSTVERFNYTFQLSDPRHLLRPFNVQVRHTDSKSRALLQLHHAIYDGWSVDLILRDLAQYLGGEKAIRRPQFDQIAAFYAELQGSAKLDLSRVYWEDAMRDFQPSSLPNMSDGQVQLSPSPLRNAYYSFPLGASSISKRLEGEVHPQVVFQAALAYLLNVYIGRTDVVFGIVTSGRTLPITGIEDIIGPCIATLPLRIDITDSLSISDLLQNIHNTTREMLEHCTLSLQEIRRVSGVNPGRPLFDVLFVWQETLDSGNAQTKGPRVVDSADFLEFDLVLELEPRESDVALVLRHRESLLPAKQMDVFFEQLKQVVDFILDSDVARLEDLTATLGNSVTSVKNRQPVYRKAKISAASCSDRKADNDTNSEGNWSDVEHQIAAAVAKITKVSEIKIGRKTSFFKLGIDSISAILLAKRLKENHGICVNVPEILESPSVASLALRIANRENLGLPQLGLVNLDSVLPEEILKGIRSSLTKNDLDASTIRPCTPLQEAMLSADLTDQLTYYEHTIFQIHGDIGKLRECFKKMCERHEILRTVFMSINHPRYGFAQVVLSSHDVFWTVEDANADDLDSHMKKAMQSNGLAIDSLKPPFSVKVFKTGSICRLLLSMHHALYDGEAMSLLLCEIEQVYHRKELPVPTSFSPFLANMASIDFERADAFWARLLRNYETTPLANLRSQIRSNNKEEQDIVITFRALELSLQDIEMASKNASVTLLSFCQAAWVKTLTLLFGELDICFGNVVNGRTLALEGLDKLIAPCFNTLPIRLTLNPHSTNQNIVEKLQRINSDSLRYQFSPLRRVQSRWSKNGQSLLDTLFILQRPVRKLDETIWLQQEEIGYMGFQIVCELTPDTLENQLSMAIHHASSVVSVEDVHYVFDVFNSALRELMDSPGAELKDAKLPNAEAFVRRTSDCLTMQAGLIKASDVVARLQESITDVEQAAVLDLTAVKASKHEIAVFLMAKRPISHLDTKAIVKKAYDVLEHLFSDARKTTYIVLTETIVLSYNGRPSRKALYRTYIKDLQAADQVSRDSSQDQNLNEVEERIREVFARFSKIPAEHITRNKTIFQLGLDSINAIQIAKSLRDDGFKLSAQGVLENPTFAGLASFLDTSDGGELSLTHEFDFTAFERRYRDVVIEQTRVAADGIESLRPCTPLQSGMVAQFLHSAGKAYFNHFELHLVADIDIDRLREAWRVVFEGSQILRTGFVPLDEAEFSFILITHKAQHVKLPWHDHTTSDCSEKESSGLRLRNSFAEGIIQALPLPAWRLDLSKTAGNIVLRFSSHHALYDAECLRMIFHDVQTAYACGSYVPPRGSFDSILSRILDSTKDQMGEHMEFWTSRLRGLSITKFPSMTPLRVKQRSVGSVSHTSFIPQSKLDHGCQEAGVTLQAALQAAWARIIAAYTGAPEVSFGVVLSGREIDGATDVMFPTTTTVPFTCVVSDENKTLLNDIMLFNSSVRKHQYSPLTQIQRWAGSASDALFDTLFVYQRSIERARNKSLWTVVDDDATVEYPVSFEAVPAKNGFLNFRVTFWDDVLPIQQAEMLLKQVDSALAEILAIGDLDEPFDHDELLSKLPPKFKELPSDVSSVHGFVETSAKLYPHKIALEFTSNLDAAFQRQQWTYAELDVKGNKYANSLIGRGVQERSIVAICFDKCPHASFATLGISKAGCAFVALDHSAPAARKAFILDDSRASMVLTTRAFAKGLQESAKVPIICVEDIEAENSPSHRPSAAEVKSDFTSYCLYTSGSTGTPKGCNLSHENVVQAILAFHRLFDGHWRGDSRWLQFASFHFDVSVLEQFWGWSAGICVVSAPRDVIFEDLGGALRKLGITHVILTPSLARLITPDDVPALCKGVFVTGGEPLRQDILDAWGPKGVIYNAYGPTECTIGCTMYTRVPGNGKPSNIGWQFDNVGTLVFHPGTTDLVLRGEPGELCISGKLVGQGYLNREKLTAERFPYLEKYGERVYRTGDLVRLLHDGSYDFLGRIDDQVKLRGQRLELGEINSAIRESVESVNDVATLVIKHHAKHTEQLVAFVVVGKVRKQDDGDLPVGQDQSVVDKIRRACQERLAGYMVPSQFVLVGRIPITSNNKIDARRLRQFHEDITKQDSVTHDNVSANSGPMNSQEERIAHSMSQLFSLDANNLCRDSNIFQLGLDSISVFGFARKLKQEGFATARPNIIMKNRTIASLAKALVDGSSSISSSIKAAKQSIAAFQHRYRLTAAKALCVGAGMIESLNPCTPLQQGMIARSFESEDALYYNTFMFDLEKDVAMDKLKSAWKTVMRAVPVLRTRFVPVDEGYAQSVVDDTELPWLEYKFRNSESLVTVSNEWRKEWVSKNNEIISRPFEIILARSSDSTILVLHLFHALYDASSLSILLHSVVAEYLDKSACYGPSFTDALPYGPLCQPDGARNFWINHLKAAQVKQLSTNFEAKDKVTTVVATRQLQTLHKLNTVRKQLNATHQALVQVCWIATLQQHVQASMTVGLVVSGRSIDFQDADQTIGPLFNTVPFYLGFEEKDTWASAVARCHEFNISALPYQHTPLRDILKWCRRSSRNPFFDSLFVFQKSAAAKDNNHAQQLWRQVEGMTRADYPLAFEAEQVHDETLHLTAVAQSSVADQETCERLLEGFENTLMILLSDPQQLIKEAFGRSFDYFRSRDVESPIEELKPTTNGFHAFDWTKEAVAIREQIANLAGTDVSEIDQVSSLFELGMDSIDAIKLSSRLKKKGIMISVSSIMRHPTVERMMDFVTTFTDSNADRQRDEQFVDIKKSLEKYFQETKPGLSEIDTILPTTPLQEAMIADMHASDFKVYFNHDVLKLGKQIDLERLKRAWAVVVKQSPILRTAFLEVDDPGISCSYAQVVQSSKELAWNDIQRSDVEHMPDLLEDVRISMVSSDNAVPFRLTAVHGRDETVLVLSIAHALYDGWSLGLIHEDVWKEYHQKPQERAPYESALKAIIMESGPDAESFWRDTVNDAPGCIFPKRTNDLRLSKETHLLEQPSDISLERIRAFSRAQNVTMQALGQTCWSFVLAWYTRTLDTVFGVVLAGRDDEESQNVLFPTMNTVAVRSVIHGPRKEMIRYVQGRLGEVMQHQHYPLRKVQQLAGLQGGKLFNTLFIYQIRPQPAVDGPRLYESIDSASSIDYPICVEMEVIDGRLVWRTACEDGTLDEGGAKELLQRLDRVLKEIMEKPDAPSIDFTQDGAAVCGLSPFKPASHGGRVGVRDEEAADMASYDESWSITENEVREAVAYVAKVSSSEVSKHHTLFHVGLDSISAIKVAAILRKRSLRITVSEMLKAGTVREIAASINGAKSDQGQSELTTIEVLNTVLEQVNVEELLAHAGIDKRAVQQVMPAFPGQVYFLSGWQRSKGVLFYPTFKHRLEGSVDLSALRRAWTQIVEQHDIMRTVFIATDNQRIPFVQVVLNNINGSFEVDNRSTGDLQVNALKSLVTLHVHQTEQYCELGLHIHHALYDAVSLRMLMRALQDRYNNQFTTHMHSNTYGDFLVLGLHNEAYSSRKSFWTEYLKNVPTTSTTVKPIRHDQRTRLFRPRAIKKIQRLAALQRAEGLSIQSLFLAAVAQMRALSSAQKNADIVLGAYLANRSHAVSQLENLAAPTVNVVPIRAVRPLQRTLVEVARQMQGDLHRVGSVEGSFVGLWEVLEWTGVKIECIVNFLRLPGEEMDSEHKQQGAKEVVGEYGDGGGDGGAEAEGIVIRQVTGEDENDVVDEREWDHEPQGVKQNVVQDAYLVSLPTPFTPTIRS